MGEALQRFAVALHPGQEDSFRLGEASSDPIVEGRPRRPGLIEPVTECFRLLAYRHNPCVAIIAVLFLRCSPAAVVRFVVAVVVSTVQRMRWRWSTSYSCKELLVRGAPALAHADASGAVVLVVGMVLVMTAGLGLGPGSIFGGFLSVRSFAMAKVDGAAVFDATIAPVAAAAFGLAALQERGSDDDVCSAITRAVPARALIGGWGSLGDEQSPESLAFQVQFAHNPMVAQEA